MGISCFFVAGLTSTEKLLVGAYAGYAGYAGYGGPPAGGPRR